MKTQTEIKQMIDSMVTKKISLNKNELDLTFVDISGKQTVEIVQWFDCGDFHRITLTEQNLRDVLRQALKFRKMINNAKKD